MSFRGLSFLSSSLSTPGPLLVLSNHGRSPPGSGLSVHCHSRGHRSAAFSPSSFWDLPVWCALLEEAYHQGQGIRAWVFVLFCVCGKTILNIPCWECYEYFILIQICFHWYYCFTSNICSSTVINISQMLICWSKSITVIKFVLIFCTFVLSYHVFFCKSHNLFSNSCKVKIMPTTKIY